MHPHQLLSLRNSLLSALREIDLMPVDKSCLTCVNYKAPHCVLAGVAPPPEVVQAGCESWLFDTNSAPF